MRHALLVFLMAATVLAATRWTLAQPIVVRVEYATGLVDQTRHADGTDIVVNLDEDPNTARTQPLTGDALIRIFDDVGSSAPQHSVGSLTVNGGGEPSTQIRLNIMVAASTVVAVPYDPTTPTSGGLINFGNATSGVGIVVTDTTLRNSTRLALSVTGSTSGNIDVGHVFRFEANDSVYGDVTAHAANGSPVTQSELSTLVNFLPIQEFRAGNAIYGKVEATAGDIDSVLVFHTAPQAIGIRGNIFAKFGSIRRIWTGGPIGTPDQVSTPGIRPKVWAGDGIAQIIARTESSSATLNADMNVDVDARFNNFYRIHPFVEGSPEFDGGIHRLWTAGNVTGTIHAANLYAIKVHGASMRAGIIAGGAISAPITIDLTTEGADIIGSTITGPVRVGMAVHGSIVAADPAAGTISSLWIGYGEDIPTLYQQNWPRAFSGSACPPVNPVTPAAWYADDNIALCQTGTFDPHLDNGSIDSVIRGRTIDDLRIRAMSRRGEGDSPRAGIPRVESPSITSLEIGDMREGVVWSGIWDAAGTWAGPDDPSDDYALIGHLTIGCVGPGAAVWFHDCPEAQITHDLLGTLHVPALPAADVIRIGGRLGAAPQSLTLSPGDLCECGSAPFNDCTYLQGTMGEASPRSTGYAEK